VSCDLAGGAALLNLSSNVYFTLNEVGSVVWNLIKEPRPLSEVRDEIVARYDVEPARCYDDLVAMLDRLADAGLITITNGSGR
jgi:hypothetical protein